MTAPDRLDLLVYSASVLTRLTQQQFVDSIRFVDPDVVVVTEPEHEYRLRQLAPAACSIATVGGYATEGVRTHTNGSVELVIVDGLSALADPTHDGSLTSGGGRYLLSVEIDLTRLETGLEGREAYERALQPASIRESYTHLSTNANRSYRSEWDGLLVRGVMPGANVRQGRQGDGIAHLQLHADGVVSTRTFTPDDFGIRTLTFARSRQETEVGVKRAIDAARSHPRGGGISRSSRTTPVSASRRDGRPRTNSKAGRWMPSFRRTPSNSGSISGRSMRPSSRGTRGRDSRSGNRSVAPVGVSRMPSRCSCRVVMRSISTSSTIRTTS
jgi:hypothetical protein